MTKKTMLVTRPLPQSVLDACAQKFEATFRDADRGLTEAEAAEALGAYDIILCTLGDRFTAQAFAQAGEIRCGLLANFGVGYNHIDADAARAAGVAVSNTPGAVTDATADIGLTLLLATARRAGEGERLVRAGAWTGWAPTQMLGAHVTGKTVGIVGMGRIGQAVAKRCALGFDMQVLYHSRSSKAVPLPAMQVGDLEELMSSADFVVVTVPATPETKHLISRDMLSVMKPGGILINISRGDVVDETALIEALEAGRIGGAGLDVYENEPQVPERLRRLDNAVLLPHLGTAALEVREAMGRMALDNACAFVKDQAPPNLVN
ncbi:lactate dehydrogenase-like 2-hydroxyacid dehydrogenase [Limimaricola soesokkakensis]|uniref:Glycerate dehydrogenase n=1 Tax=Limimaricola soesokkakensis TaxID=1343159 RepID=A0A1X6YVL4_9RHOB|nr:D-glycerate dehydrogenase [Limimaricola soesokkakensis]PSK87619.1 lactate dehydrogenase-like 2-hydroxyacid dehydrogenase [Limimaricola soesokkakensis]SLN31860.1 Glycerate dehydrogenase [Limimaricola soesokkakensis]